MKLKTYWKLTSDHHSHRIRLLDSI